MNKAGFLVLSAVVSMGSFLLSGTGCGDSTSGTGGGGGAGSTSTSVSTSVSTTTSTTTSTSVSTSGSGMPVAATCTKYCADIAANCAAPDNQWASPASCMAACATFPQGKIGDKAGDSLECRAYHAGAAKGPPAMPAVHCNHAGPTGGAKSGAAVDDGPCGNGCEAFCNLAVKTCGTQYKDVAACMPICAGFKKSAADYTVADVDKDDFGCRMYHLTVAATDAMSATTHCPHTLAVSTQCTK